MREHICSWCGYVIKKDDYCHQEGVNGNTLYFHWTLLKNCYDKYLQGVAAQTAARSVN